MDGETAFILVSNELSIAEIDFKPFHSPHEGIAVIKEEYDELWDEIKVKASCRDKAVMQKEASHLAAMAIRFLIDLC